MLDVKAALQEVQQKSAEQIEQETAYKWASRAIACDMLYKQTGLLHWLLRAEDMKHEALEHAAVVMDRGATVRTLQDVLSRKK